MYALDQTDLWLDFSIKQCIFNILTQYLYFFFHSWSTYISVCSVVKMVKANIDWLRKGWASSILLSCTFPLPLIAWRWHREKINSRHSQELCSLGLSGWFHTNSSTRPSELLLQFRPSWTYSFHCGDTSGVQFYGHSTKKIIRKKHPPIPSYWVFYLRAFYSEDFASSSFILKMGFHQQLETIFSHEEKERWERVCQANRI